MILKPPQNTYYLSICHNFFAAAAVFKSITIHCDGDNSATTPLLSYWLLSAPYQISNVYSDDSELMTIEHLVSILPPDGCFHVARLPLYMKDVACVISNNAIGCFFFSQSLKDYIARLIARYDHEALMNLHESPDSFNQQCIDHVIDHYIKKSVELFEQVLSQGGGNKDYTWINYSCIFESCKERSMQKRMKRGRDEKYLGRITFRDDLRRSFDEFLLCVKNDFGFLPYSYTI